MSLISSHQSCFDVRIEGRLEVDGMRFPVEGLKVRLPWCRLTGERSAYNGGSES